MMFSLSRRSLLGFSGAASKNALLKPLSVANRTFFGKKEVKKMDPKETDFDLIIVGGANAAALGKFIQTDHIFHGKLAVVTSHPKYLQPQNYFQVSYGQIKILNYETASVASMLKPEARIDSGVWVNKYLPHQNKIELSNGKTYTYKALAVANGFQHDYSGIQGLQEMDHKKSDDVVVHMVDKLSRINRNHWQGFHHTKGEFIVYHPEFPYKGEGSDFYAFYYEHHLRHSKIIEASSKDAQITIYTPNDVLNRFPYANEYLLEECKKRQINIKFGQKLVKVQEKADGCKYGHFVNTKTGEKYQAPFYSLSVNPPSRPHKQLAQSELTDSNGLVTVNPYTLQHRKFENIFAFGDCTDVDTTRTVLSAAHQAPVVKQNLTQFLEGKELNGIYDGYSWWYLTLGAGSSTSFSHLHNYEPHAMNNVIPKHGIIPKLYNTWMCRGLTSFGDKYTSMKGNSGPPYYRTAYKWPNLEYNTYYQEKVVGKQQGQKKVQGASS